MKRYAISLVVLGVITSLIASVGLWLYTEGVVSFPSDQSATDFYMILDSLSKFSIVLAFYISLTERDILKRIVFVVTLYAFGEVLDELFFDPCKMQLNEIVLIIISTIYVVFYARKTLSDK
jgi:hypothetical protein